MVPKGIKSSKKKKKPKQGGVHSSLLRLKMMINQSNQCLILKAIDIFQDSLNS